RCGVVCCCASWFVLLFFYFSLRATAPTEIYTLSLHDALPICEYLHKLGRDCTEFGVQRGPMGLQVVRREEAEALKALLADPDSADRKSTRLNSSHVKISYAVFCLKKKKTRT